MKSARERYINDPQFRHLVDTMTGAILQCQYTPSEMREAAILASIKYEEMQVHSTAYIRLEELNTIEEQITKLLHNNGQ
jgi:hypothetical protein